MIDISQHAPLHFEGLYVVLSRNDVVERGRG